LIILFLSTSAAGVPYTELFVFGANQEEIGNNKDFPNPNNIFAGGTQSNGKVYVQALYEMLGLGRLKPSSEGGTNYAWATQRSWPLDHDMSVREQVEAFLAVLGDSTTVDPDALYLVNGSMGDFWTGLDYLNTDTQPAARTYVKAQAESTMVLVQLPAQHGARHFVVPQKTEPSQFLGSQILDETQQALFDRAQLAAEHYNTGLGALLFGVQSDSVRVVLVPFAQWVTAAIREGLILRYLSAPLPPEDPNKYFNLVGWGDFNLPTEAAHLILADVIMELINRLPEVRNQIEDLSLSVEDEPWVIHLGFSEVYIDDDEDALTYTVKSSADSIVLATIDRSLLTLVPIADGTARISLSAQDAGFRKTPMSFQVTVLSTRGAISPAVETLDFGNVEVNRPGTVILTISNSGEGPLNVSDVSSDIPDHVMAKIFDPFFTTKGPDRGTGLGMSISRSIVDEIGGTLNVDSVPGEGTTISIDFPPPAEEAD